MRLGNRWNWDMLGFPNLLEYVECSTEMPLSVPATLGVQSFAKGEAASYCKNRGPRLQGEAELGTHAETDHWLCGFNPLWWFPHLTVTCETHLIVLLDGSETMCSGQDLGCSQELLEIWGMKEAVWTSWEKIGCWKNLFLVILPVLVFLFSRLHRISGSLPPEKQT